jgi:hypothetical protein
MLNLRIIIEFFWLVFDFVGLWNHDFTRVDYFFVWLNTHSLTHVFKLYFIDGFAVWNRSLNSSLLFHEILFKSHLMSKHHLTLLTKASWLDWPGFDDLVLFYGWWYFLKAILFVWKCRYHWVGKALRLLVLRTDWFDLLAVDSLFLLFLLQMLFLCLFHQVCLTTWLRI